MMMINRKHYVNLCPALAAKVIVPDWGIKLTWQREGCRTSPPGYIGGRLVIQLYVGVIYIPYSGTMNLVTEEQKLNS